MIAWMTHPHHPSVDSRRHMFATERLGLVPIHPNVHFHTNLFISIVSFVPHPPIYPCSPIAQCFPLRFTIPTSFYHHHMTSYLYSNRCLSPKSGLPRARSNRYIFDAILSDLNNSQLVVYTVCCYFLRCVHEF